MLPGIMQRKKNSRRGKPVSHQRGAGWNRRFTAAAYVLAAVLAVGLLAALYLKMGNRQERYEATFFGSFDTVTVVTGYARTQEIFEEQAGKLEQKLREYHELFDIYHTYEGTSNIKAINDAAGEEPVKVSQDIINMLKMGIDMYHKTEGKVNIAYGSVLSLWHEYREEGLRNPKHARIPTKEELDGRAEHTDMDDLIIDEELSTVFLRDGEMSLDVGSIGKGYAVQKLADYAKEIGMEHALISVGGNVCAVGGKADAASWVVGVENPRPDSGKPYIATVELDSGCIVTSGDYQRYYEVEGQRYCHIIDTDTNMPPQYVSAVSVRAKDSGVADAVSTALFNMDFEAGLSLVEEMEDVEAMWVEKDGQIRCSGGFKIYEEK